ncbi:uncharacterized protein LOC127136117 [Lathyrus oleraceus]|uniref:uncharacterized protein LOC127136117 n=1 Tax=Pisum sativum TaxID=3888 RepID=UPI0021CE8754|nr:uncharacterized protein LOC127136117 [Pisum sativum]
MPPKNPIEDKNKKEAKPEIKLRYYQRMKKKDLNKNNFEKFLEIFKKLEINIPFFEELEQIPMYQKFMKDIISKKRTMGDKPITFIEKCSAVSQGRKIPTKQKDPGVVTIPYTIEDRTFKKVLIDSGASVSVMSLFIYQKLGIGKANNTWTNLKFAYHSIKHAYEIVEDNLVIIDEFSFPVDFVIMDMPEDENTLIILG